MNEFDKLVKIQKLGKMLSSDVWEVKRLMTFLNIKDEDTRKNINDTLNMIDKKASKIKKLDDLDKLKKYVKIKKVIKNYDK